MRKAEKVEANATVLSLQETPIPTPIMFCSQMKHSINLPASTLNIVWEKVEFFMSPSRATTALLEVAIFSKALP